jgi:hypothetical protein
MESEYEECIHVLSIQLKYLCCCFEGLLFVEQAKLIYHGLTDICIDHRWVVVDNFVVDVDTIIVPAAV